MLTTPTFVEEALLHDQGYRLVAGIDEVGRGALAGPVVASAVIMPAELNTPWQGMVRDSKLLTPARREELARYIQASAVAIGTGVIPHQVIDRRGIAEATRMAMRQAVRRLQPAPEYLLIDYFHLPHAGIPQKGVAEGDTLCFSIACASIVAKVFRDHLMVELDQDYPGYGLAQHKGYGTEEHLACLAQLGPCPIHRRSFQPVRTAASDAA